MKLHSQQLMENEIFAAHCLASQAARAGENLYILTLPTNARYWIDSLNQKNPCFPVYISSNPKTMGT